DNEVSIQKDTDDTQDNKESEDKVNENHKDAETTPKNEDDTKSPATSEKTTTSNTEKSKAEENATTKNEYKDTGNAKEELSNGVYKADVSRERLDEVKDSYYKQMGEVQTYFGRHFVKTGELAFPDEKESNNSYTKHFYDIMDKNLNELWSGLKTILSENEMKKLTQQQLQWIKEKDSIKREETPILTAEANTLYAKGQDTYKRLNYLADKYLNY
ncbi:lysozyme inhibitor LprI family protein, partial [Clostridium tarantellae]|uniref:lysozyme inhibitor LprI family protein n=1 Tax=Clostridium tarantellae TaxID=39493 RepID=UPI001478804E